MKAMQADPMVPPGQTANRIRLLAVVLVDVTNSPELTAEVGDLAWSGVRKRFFTRLDELEHRCNGRIVKRWGDGLLAVFEDVADAFSAASTLLRSLAEQPIVVGEQAVSVRMSIHVGRLSFTSTTYGEDVFGDDLILAARLMSLAGPGEAIVSEAARVLLPPQQQALLEASAPADVKGSPAPIEISRFRPVLNRHAQ